MKKNLLLVLMALLPILAWAQETADIIVQPVNLEPEYGEAVPQTGAAVNPAWFTYSGIEVTPENTAAIAACLDYNTYDREIKNVGTYTYTLTIKEQNFTGHTVGVQGVGNIVVKAKSIAQAWDATIEEGPFTYKAAEWKPAVSKVFTGEEGEEGYQELGENDFEVTYADNVNASENAQIIITGIGNYKDSFTKTFTIDPKDITETGSIEWAEESFTYTRAAQNLVGKVFDGEMELNGNPETPAVDYQVAYYADEACEGEPVEAIDAATYYVKVTGTGNYTGSFVESADINPRDINDGVKINSSAFSAKKYTGSQITISAGGRLYYPETGPENRLTKGTDFTFEWGENIEVGEGAGSITFTGTGNYTGTRTVTFDIVAASVEGDELPAGLAFEDYEDEEYIAAQITPETEGKVTLAVGNEEPVALVEGTDYTVEYGENVNVGEGTITYTFIKNFKGSYEKVFNIVPATLTVTADDYSKSFGSLDPTFTYTVEGFKGEDSAELLEGLIEVTKDPAGANEAGTYALVPGWADPEFGGLDNYEVEFVNGILTIGKATLTVTVNAAEKTYGDADPDFTYTVSGLANNDTEQVLTGEAAFEREPGENVGEYAVLVSGLEATSYIVQFVPGTLTINKAPITLTVNNQTINFGDTPELGVGYNDKAKGTDPAKPTISFQGAALKNNDNRASLGLTLAYDDSDIKIGTNEGVLTVTATNENYEYTYVAGDVIVNANEYGLILYTDNKADYIEELDKNEATIKAYDGIEVNQVQITSTNYSMKAEQWYTLVLPFETTVRTISQAFGYAVVDVLNVANTTVNEYYFDNVMGTIPANTPFILKIDQPIQNGINISINAPYGPVEVEGDEPTVVWQEIPFTIEYADAPQVTDAAGNVFCGTYGKMNLNNGENVFSIGDGKIHATNAGAYLRPLAAYLAPANAEAPVRVFIEEIDGTVTAINSVDAEANGAAAEGWYTISGVKLNAQPTEKGIYIFNGKKVAIQ